MFPDDPPRFLARTPHGYHDPDRIRADLDAAGFSSIAIDAVEHRSKAGSARDPAIGYCQGTPLRSEIEARGAARLEEATERAADAVARQFGPGRRPHPRFGDHRDARIVEARSRTRFIPQAGPRLGPRRAHNASQGPRETCVSRAGFFKTECPSLR
jgi:hypothetical protein